MQIGRLAIDICNVFQIKIIKVYKVLGEDIKFNE